MPELRRFLPHLFDLAFETLRFELAFAQFPRFHRDSPLDSVGELVKQPSRLPHFRVNSTPIVIDERHFRRVKSGNHAAHEDVADSIADDFFPQVLDLRFGAVELRRIARPRLTARLVIGKSDAALERLNSGKWPAKDCGMEFGKFCLFGDNGNLEIADQFFEFRANGNRTFTVFLLPLETRLRLIVTQVVHCQELLLEAVRESEPQQNVTSAFGQFSKARDQKNGVRVRPHCR
jgi:hypothetical protein